ncbi:MAG: hypothetical protein ACLFOY_15730 [Desulfatibacillaceae bacterium]
MQLAITDKMPDWATEKMHHALFAGMLQGLARGVCVAARLWDDFAQRLGEKDTVFLMNTEEDGPEGWFTIRGGRIGLRYKSDRTPDFTLTWKSSEVAWRAMFAMATGDPKAISKAVMAGELKLSGDAGSIGWFMGVLNLMAKCYMKRGTARIAEMTDVPPISMARDIMSKLPVPGLRRASQRTPA